jgi:hypothetical protein
MSRTRCSLRPRSMDLSTDHALSRVTSLIALAGSRLKRQGRRRGPFAWKGGAQIADAEEPWRSFGNWIGAPRPSLKRRRRDEIAPVDQQELKMAVRLEDDPWVLTTCVVSLHPRNCIERDRRPGDDQRSRCSTRVARTHDRWRLLDSGAQDTLLLWTGQEQPQDAAERVPTSRSRSTALRGRVRVRASAASPGRTLPREPACSRALAATLGR